jgi:murein L,D-transpeptidase YcbB/YkuD
VAGVSGSYHTYGQAADIKVDGVKPAEVAKYAESIGVLGIGLYETDADGHFVHVDTRTKKSFWYGQKQQRRDTFGGAVEKAVQTVEIKLPVLELGSSGDSVKVLQLILNSIDGCSCGKADGIFGSKTFEALKIFQKKNGLVADGICGAKTWKALLGA